jgi:hypothetical protein
MSPAVALPCLTVPVWYMYVRLGRDRPGGRVVVVGSPYSRGGLLPSRPPPLPPPPLPRPCPRPMAPPPGGPPPQGYKYLVRFLDPPGPEEVARAEGGATIAAWLETVYRKGLRAEFEAWADVLDGRVAGGKRRSGLGGGPGSRSRLHAHVSIFVCGARGFMPCAHVHVRAPAIPLFLLAPFPHGTGEEGKGDEDPLPFISQYVPRVLCCGGKWVSPGAVLTSPTSAPLPLSARHLRHMYALHDLSLPSSPFRKTLLQLQALDAAVTSVPADAPNAPNCQR